MKSQRYIRCTESWHSAERITKLAGQREYPDFVPDLLNLDSGWCAPFGRVGFVYKYVVPAIAVALTKYTLFV